MNNDMYNSGDVYAQEPVVSEQHKTTYGSMNDWMGVQDRVASTNVPVTMSDSNWMQKTMLTEQNPTFDDKYSRAYTDLSKQIAYRHPNPGKARERQGRIGGSWRHIKEVLGHGGSRVVFVDGKNDRIPPRVYKNQGAREGRSGGHWRNVTEVQGHSGSQVCFVNTPRDVEITGELQTPRTGRTGRAGGQWRHMTEVVGHGGSQVMFVDGLVGTYDSNKFTDQLYEQQFARPHLNGDGYVPAKIGLTTTGIPEYDPLRTARLPSVPDATPRYYDEDVSRKMALLAEDKYKGFYKYK
ncbi:hypothetical protein LOTGIDRAFT_228247 [Lottia gigantea]|uniref:Uncharacterized protein n=1 Tax=Lottia gigantea TaxID=225164 RepID=V4C7E5_LOTGI|nr:hypothetical protein LOTGIDRAFT_228247 [Lottia gigantea]ESO97614.1 hypothetical protein LOTGIDRAFT_228247 [Lottia gigantea]